MKRMSMTFSLYLVRQYMHSVAIAYTSLFGLVVLIDVMELLRRAAGREEAIAFARLLEMALLKAPQMSMMLLPYAILIGMMLALARLTRTSELIVARAAGVSVWQFLAPGLLMAVVVASVFLGVISPVSAVMLERYERLEAKLLTGQSSLLSVSSSGLWLRQQGDNTPANPEYIIHALRVSEQGEKLWDVTVFLFDGASNFVQRLDSAEADLQQHQWVMHDVRVSEIGKAPRAQAQTILPTQLTLSQIQDSFASPETLSFWELPQFIHTLEAAGFSGLRHRLYWHRLLSLPLLLVAMGLMAALFSMRLPRRGAVLFLIASGLITGFLLLFVSDIIFALGLSGTLPVWLAAWLPAMASTMLATAMLLHVEDG